MEIGKCQETKYLGFILSSSGDNLVNTTSIRNKSIGITKKIFTKLNSLKLRKYYFECGIIFMNVMLRSSILYACETYYNMKENEIRQIERIEEPFMRKLLDTKKGCPINQLYLELGQIPARFDIIRIRLSFLKYILNQEDASLLCHFFKLQLEKPTRGDWGSICKRDMNELDIQMTFDEIKEISINKFSAIVKQKCKDSAYNYLMNRRGSKGIEIEYNRIQMSEYLLPNNELNIENQQKLFAIRNKMVNIPSNFTAREKNYSKCICGEKENMEHIYVCENLNSENL